MKRVPISSSKTPGRPIGVLFFSFSINSSFSNNSLLISVLKYHGERAFTVMLNLAHSLANCLVNCTTAAMVSNDNTSNNRVVSR